MLNCLQIWLFSTPKRGGSIKAPPDKSRLSNAQHVSLLPSSADRRAVVEAAELATGKSPKSGAGKNSYVGASRYI
jgi:hypothetical protein